MYLIVGLGNPENKYSNTRHNMGFDVINQIAKKYNLEIKKEKFDGLYDTTRNRRKKGHPIKTPNIHELKWRSSKKIYGILQYNKPRANNNL